MKRVVLIGAGIALVAWLGWNVLLANVSDETRIRWVVDGAAAGFNDQDVGDCVAWFHDDYRETTRDIDKPGLRRVLQFVVVRAMQSRGPTLRVEVDELAIDELDSDAGTASISFRARLLDDETAAWELDVAAGLLRDDDGWRFHRSSYETVSGSPPR